MMSIVSIIRNHATAAKDFQFKMAQIKAAYLLGQKSKAIMAEIAYLSVFF